MPQLSQKSSQASPLKSRMKDQMLFLKRWVDAPLKTGAVAPSSQALAEAMAAKVPESEAPVIELGPGTGVVTAALLRRDIDPKRLILVEYSPEFASLLRARYPEVQVIEGDAYALESLLKKQGIEKVSAVVSSLPLFTRPMKERTALLQAAFKVFEENAPFIQFSYALVPAFSKEDVPFQAEVSRWVMRNIPPARVWCYRKP